MTSVTKAALAYIATQVRTEYLCLRLALILMLTQVRFALCSSSTFSRTDLVTDSETFYKSILGLLEDPEEKAEVDALLIWWNR